MELIEFEDLLEQYEEDELTADIIYDLCVKFKSLPLSERGDYTWESLNERFGHFKATGENLRCWVKGKQYEDGTIVENPRVLKDGQTPNDLKENAVAFDEAMEEWKKLYDEVGLDVQYYENLESLENLYKNGKGLKV